MKKLYTAPSMEQTEVLLRAGICSPVGEEENPVTPHPEAPARKLYV